MSPALQGVAAQPSTRRWAWGCLLEAVPLQHPASPRDGWAKGSPPPPVLPCFAPTQPSSQPEGLAGPTGTDRVLAACTDPELCKRGTVRHMVARGTAEPGAAALGEAALPPVLLCLPPN